MQSELEHIRDWAKNKLQGGSEPPWAWYQYMKLVETTDAILAGMSAPAHPRLRLGFLGNVLIRNVLTPGLALAGARTGEPAE